MTDEEQFTLLFQEHYPRVLAFVVRRTQPAGAHDVVAETFTTAWRHIRRLPEEPLPWLYRTARNCLANEHRKAVRRGRLIDQLAWRHPVQEPDHAVSVVQDAQLRYALGRLNPADREALLLIGWEELDHAGAALVLGCSVSAFTVRVHRARKKLARLLAEAEPETTSTPLHPSQPSLSATTSGARSSQEF